LRTDRLASDGYRVLRFWNHEVLGSTETVLERISRVVEERRVTGRGRGVFDPPHPDPLPSGRGDQSSEFPLPDGRELG
jgi:adenine-specific DNA-methyltransferase